jgi:hypothetical protein
MRYAVALVVAAAITGCLIFYVRRTDRVIEQAIRQMLAKQQQAGTLPPELQDIDPRTADLGKLGDFQTSLPRGIERRVKLSYWLAGYWFVWVPLVVVLCLGVASMVGRAGDGEKFVQFPA